MTSRRYRPSLVFHLPVAALCGSCTGCSASESVNGNPAVPTGEQKPPLAHVGLTDGTSLKAGPGCLRQLPAHTGVTLPRSNTRATRSTGGTRGFPGILPDSLVGRPRASGPPPGGPRPGGTSPIPQ